MKISQRIHQRIRIKNILLTLSLLCVISFLAWLSIQYSSHSDWTDSSRNSLTEASQKVLDTLTDKVEITAYVPEDRRLRKQITQVISRYSLYKPDLTLKFISLTAQPDKTRELNIDAEGAILISYRQGSEKLNTLTESTMTNALLRLAHGRKRWITFLSGHDERSPTNDANHDLAQFRKALEQRNIKVMTINLANLASIPDNSSLLVLAGPKAALLNAEMEILLDYLAQGGNLLWLRDPDDQQLPEMEEQIGIHRLPGTIVDSSSQLYGVDNPTYVLATQYAHHAITRGFKTITLYPVSAALESYEETEYQPEAIISSIARSWTETGPVSGKISFDADSDETEGPLDIAFALTRNINQDTQQRIIVAGDGDFLSNAFVNHVGNLDMGLRMINWLTQDDRFIDIPSRIAPDQSLQLSKLSMAVMAYGFLLALPLAFFITGVFIWRKRKNR